jgi:hypothetical protein
MNENIYEEGGELYGQFFMFNNEMNNAGDPVNYKIYPENNEKIAKSFIGRPYIIPKKDKKGNWETKHVRADTLPELLNKQKKLSAGEIVRYHRNAMTGNYNAIVKFFPEYHDRIRKGDFPPFTSPMFAHSDSSFDENGKLHIKDGMAVHLHGVPKGGYRPEISGIKSICEGGLNECMNELKIVAAAGKLAELQSDERFSKEKIAKSESNMSMQEPTQAPQPAQAGGESEARIGALEKTVAELQKMLQELVAKLGGQQAPAPAAAPPVGAAGEQAVVTEAPQETPEDKASIIAELAQIKAERAVEKESLQKERETLKLQERTRIATEIVENKIKLHRLSPDMHDAEITKLVELQDSDGKPADLTLVNEEIKSSLQQLVGASGNFAELTLEETHVDQDVNHISAMEAIG